MKTLAETFWIALPLVALATPVPAQSPGLDATLKQVSGLALVDQVLSENPDLVGWEDAQLTYYVPFLDPSGQDLFYEVGVEVDGQRAGRIKIGAAPVLGTVVLAVESTPRPFSLIDSGWLAIFLVQATHPDANVVAAFPLAYDGLDTGVLIFFRYPETGTFDFEIYDLTTLQLVPLSLVRSSLAAIPADEYQERTDEFVRDVEYAYAIEELFNAEGGSLTDVWAEPFDVNHWTALQQVAGNLLTTEPHILVDINRCKLYLQEESDWCARAVSQMFNHYYLGGPLHTQTVIDGLLNGLGWDTYWQSALSYYLEFYTGVSDAGFHPVYPKDPASATWPSLEAEIQANRPLGLYSSPGPNAHITFGVGYQITTKTPPPGFIFGTDPIEERWLHEYDPAQGVRTIKAWRGDAMTYLGVLAGWFHARP